MRNPYSGRLIFDHFPKTAGQAVNTWLTHVLGTGTVNPRQAGRHAELLSEAGLFPIISAHVHFADGEGLDPRFQYATIFREPVDRAISWLHFVINNHARTDLGEVYDACAAYVESEGERFCPELAAHLVNSCVMHFAAIHGAKDLNDRELVDAAFETIQAYDCIGLYERLDEFVAGLGSLIGIPAPPSLQPVNVTLSRPAANRISPKLRKNLLRITKLDRQLYARVSKLVAQRLEAEPPVPPVASRWSRYERIPLPPQITPAMTLHGARSLEGAAVHRGAIMRFELDFELHEAVGRLQAGFHIFDDLKRWAFGVNNVLLNEPFDTLQPGRYRLTHLVTSDLPAGDYTIGFAFADISEDAEKNLFWQDETLPFQVALPAGAVGVGYARCHARMVLRSPKAVTEPRYGPTAEFAEKLVAAPFLPISAAIPS